MSKSLGLDQAKIHGGINFNISKLAVGVSCAHRCVIVGNICNVGAKPNCKNYQLIVYAFKLLYKAKQKYIPIERGALTMVYALHKFKHF